MRKNLVWLGIAVAVGIACSHSLQSAGTAFAAAAAAAYQGRVVTEWLPDGRTMRLLEDFAFVDAAGRRWLAPKGSPIDGASIPRALWWSGGPYEGTYREASVVHDVYCAENPKTATWQAVHRMFYDAMLTSGVEKARALVMYGAVYRHGPRWAPPPGSPAPAGPLPSRPTKPLEQDVKDLESLVDSGKVSEPGQVEALPSTIIPPK